MRRLRDAVAETAARLQQAGVDNPRLDARVLIAHVLEIDAAQTFLRNEHPLTEAQEAKLLDMIVRRLKREPVSRIVGHREFWGLDFEITPDTLDPRAETEVAVSAVIDHCRRLKIERPRILDLGTGSGCIITALLHAIPGATGVATDRSPRALAVARRNAQRHNAAAKFACMNWSDALSGPFDVIVSNPPYLNAKDMDTLSPEVRFDPRAALDGGDDGLTAYRAIAGDAARLVATGLLVLEVGQGQADAVARIVVTAGWLAVETRPDLATIPRCVVAQK